MQHGPRCTHILRPRRGMFNAINTVAACQHSNPPPTPPCHTHPLSLCPADAGVVNSIQLFCLFAQMCCNHSAACLPVACLFVCLFVGLLYAALLPRPATHPSPCPCHTFYFPHRARSTSVGSRNCCLFVRRRDFLETYPLPCPLPLPHPPPPTLPPLQLASKLKLTRNPIGVP